MNQSTDSLTKSTYFANVNYISRSKLLGKSIELEYSISKGLSRSRDKNLRLGKNDLPVFGASASCDFMQKCSVM